MELAMDVMSTEHSRREALRLAGLAGLALIVAPGRAEAGPDEVSAAIAKLYGEKKPESGKIKLDVPEIAENGLVVPINLEVESPMTEADYVRAVHVFADGNPLPNVISYKFTPACGKAAAAADQLRTAFLALDVEFPDVTDTESTTAGPGQGW